MDHQIHFARKFYLDKSRGYWISCDYGKDNPRIRAHQWVWIKFHGPIPKGYHIHHVNGDKSDNRIENLELISKSRHCSHHMQDPKRKELARQNCNRIRPMTKAWHASEEGHLWHRLHAIKMNFGNGESFKYDCQQCSNPYESKIIAKSRTRFCSNNCKSAWRRAQGLDNISRKCLRCEEDFIVNKYSKQKYCSRGCVHDRKD